MENKEVRLIDANALLEQTEIICGRYEVQWTDNRVMVWIDNAPTIDPESLRPHGKWTKDHMCTNCGEFALEAPEAHCYYHTIYCPHCGAFMDKED